MLHSFATSIAGIPLPEKFTYPFCYTPHPLCILAARETQAYLCAQAQWQDELQTGKMFGVLVVQTSGGHIGYLAAFSGLLAGKSHIPFFVPPVYDLQQPDGFFKKEEKLISQLNARIDRLEQSDTYRHTRQTLHDSKRAADQVLTDAKLRMKQAKAERDALRTRGNTDAETERRLTRESQFQKAEYRRQKQALENHIALLRQQMSAQEGLIEQLKTERKERSAALQRRIFEHFDLLNANGEHRNLCQIFAPTVHRTPPAGAGECAAPKLLQQAYLHGWKPLCMAEFWWGDSPKSEPRRHGHYYPACKGKCGPILSFMLQGLDVEDSPLTTALLRSADLPLPTVYDDPWLAVVCKPSGMPSVPGTEPRAVSVADVVRRRYPAAEGPLIVHRLDMDTSGLMLIAKDKDTYRHLQEQFKNRTVCKRYLALLDGNPPDDSGIIRLPLSPSPFDRPRQVVDYLHGKPAETYYAVVRRMPSQALVAFYPQTGRTHQLRIHAAHPDGLHCPIAGDALYGTSPGRLCLHAESITFVHPVSQRLLTFHSPADFPL